MSCGQFDRMEKNRAFLVDSLKCHMEHLLDSEYVKIIDRYYIYIYI